MSELQYAIQKVDQLIREAKATKPKINQVLNIARSCSRTEGVDAIRETEDHYNAFLASLEEVRRRI